MIHFLRGSQIFAASGRDIFVPEQELPSSFDGHTSYTFSVVQVAGKPRAADLVITASECDYSRPPTKSEFPLSTFISQRDTAKLK